MEKQVLVVHAYNRVFDAFWEKGWMNWTRFLVKKGKVIFIKGQEITKEDEKVLLANLPVVEE